MGYYDQALEHHGILGQKWGVRRFENKNGELTAAGKARYNTDANGNYKKLSEAQKNADSAKKVYKEAKKKAANSYDMRDQESYRKAAGMYDLRKKQVSDAKARISMEKRKKNPSEHEQKLVDKYKEKGMSQEEAELAAYKKVRLEKALAIGATVTVAAAAAYGAKKYHDYVSDEVLKAGSTKLKRVTADGTENLYDTFYAAQGRDAHKYVGMYGNQIKRGGSQDVYQKTLGLTKDLKIAGNKNAKNTMAETLSKASEQSKNEVLDTLRLHRLAFAQVGATKQYNTMRKGIKDIEAGKYNTKAAYDALNIGMTGGNQSQIYKDFKQNLKDKGYSGIKDRNDESYSGYAAKTARIMFDNSNIKVENVRKVGNNEIAIKNLVAQGGALARALAPQVAATAGATVAVKSASRKVENNRAIAKYKKEHPDTKLTNDEILENYYGEK